MSLIDSRHAFSNTQYLICGIVNVRPVPIGGFCTFGESGAGVNTGAGAGTDIGAGAGAGTDIGAGAGAGLGGVGFGELNSFSIDDPKNVYARMSIAMQRCHLSKVLNGTLPINL
jgi:hypothetical protein